MLKRVFLVCMSLILVLGVSGCDLPQEEQTPDYTGLWQSVENPDLYSVLIHQKSGDRVTVSITALRESGTQTDFADVYDVPIVDGVANFHIKQYIMDADCTIEFSGDEMYIRYENEMFNENTSWSIILMPEGPYTKTKELEDVPSDWLEETRNKGGFYPDDVTIPKGAYDLEKYEGTWVYTLDVTHNLTSNMLIYQLDEDTITMQHDDFLDEATFVSENVAESERFGYSNENKTVYTFSTDENGTMVMDVQVVNVETGEKVGNPGFAYKVD